MMSVQGQPELLQVVLAFRAISRLSYRLHGRQQQADENRNDCDDNKQFD
jgi:hypothetical protein